MQVPENLQPIAQEPASAIWSSLTTLPEIHNPRGKTMNGYSSVASTLTRPLCILAIGRPEETPPGGLITHLHVDLA